MIVATPIQADGTTGPAWGRAHWVAVADVGEGGAVTSWQVYEVDWDGLHDSVTEGSHHARVATFLGTHQVRAVVVDHVGPGMVRMLDSMGIAILDARPGDAHASVQAAVAG